MTSAYRSTVTWLDQALGCFSAAVERMPDEVFLAEHQAAHDEPRSATIDLVAAVFEPVLASISGRPRR